MILNYILDIISTPVISFILPYYYDIKKLLQLNYITIKNPCYFY